MDKRRVVQITVILWGCTVGVTEARCDESVFQEIIIEPTQAEVHVLIRCKGLGVQMKLAEPSF